MAFMYELEEMDKRQANRHEALKNRYLPSTEEQRRRRREAAAQRANKHGAAAVRRDKCSPK